MKIESAQEQSFPQQASQFGQDSQ